MKEAQLDLPALLAPFESLPDLTKAMQDLYEELDSAIAAHKPTCWNHGDCCKFSAYGHRLYVTSLELAYFRQGNNSAWRIPDGSGACPHQIGGRCTARDHRPLGCRVFFCDPTAQDWQGPLYEEFQTRLKSLGSSLGLEYRYIEWLSALRGWSETSEPVHGPDVDPVRSDVIELTVLN